MLLSIFFYASGPDYKHENLYPTYQFNLSEQKVQRILKTLREVESNGNYQARGKSGEYGAYQFRKSTWNYWCNKTIGYEIDIKIPSNQDVIAGQKVRYLIDKGYNVNEIASFWNSGKIAYQSKGVNRYGVRYNVSNYVMKFNTIYNQI
jgi:hypothetical protein